MTFAPTLRITIGYGQGVGAGNLINNTFQQFNYRNPCPNGFENCNFWSLNNQCTSYFGAGEGCLDGNCSCAFNCGNGAGAGYPGDCQECIDYYNVPPGSSMANNNFDRWNVGYVTSNLSITLSNQYLQNPNRYISIGFFEQTPDDTCSNAGGNDLYPFYLEVYKLNGVVYEPFIIATVNTSTRIWFEPCTGEILNRTN
jgi:hypothetical protein